MLRRITIVRRGKVLKMMMIKNDDDFDKIDDFKKTDDF